jgi:endoglucanase
MKKKQQQAIWKIIRLRRLPPTWVALAGVAVNVGVGVLLLHHTLAYSPPVSAEPDAVTIDTTKPMKKSTAKIGLPPPPKTAATKQAATPTTATTPAQAAKAVPVLPSPQSIPVKPVAAGAVWPIRDLYVETGTSAASQAQSWAASRPADAAAMTRLAAQPQAVWFGGWNTNVTGDVSSYVGAAAAAGKMPVLVAYNIPNRDCGGYSAGGAAAAADYAAWIQGVVNGINGRPAVVILEPDALSDFGCLNAAQQQDRLSMIKSAVNSFKSRSGTFVYLDSGNPGWQSAATMTSRLKQAGIDGADGFSLNVSNFYSNAQNVSYGNSISSQVGGKHYVIDTSRNGNGTNSEWCNPSGRALGTLPTTSGVPSGLADALLWIKTPGESDGTCNGGPSAGAWWADYALGLARNAGW